jgi:putative ABC transport system permease protein
MDDVLARTFAQPRLRTRLLGAFAAVAVLLSAIGIYGLLMYSVAQRTREIGIRMALGADRRRVLRSIMAEGLALVAVGAASGLVMSAYLARLIEKILYGVEGLDPVTMAAASAILIAASLIAIYVPARRATRVDPFVALRAE